MLILSDIQLLRKIKEGDIHAFEELFRLYHSPLCLYSASITGRMSIAEEVVQDVFYYLWKERQKIQILHSIKSYLYGAVRNRSFQYYEQKQVFERYKQSMADGDQAGFLPGPQEELEYKELESTIHKILNQLPERRKRIFRMHREEGYKYDEIACQLNISVKTVEAEMSKALQTLKKEIEHYIYIL